MVAKARESLTMERKNARQTGGGHPMKAADTITMSIIETMGFRVLLNPKPPSVCDHPCT
ncbi:hypothetical protein DPMN_039084 [Dreissena polymorpha]|uniref:Uncharacterized protein n=1 Tax=Dreissena polymorpha TaxID=45954 RepID=A0A9D4RRD1_DREPO|nr:hypothetical protein DPMN_039084 [Dreissena polymorpha]